MKLDSRSAVLVGSKAMKVAGLALALGLLGGCHPAVEVVTRVWPVTDGRMLVEKCTVQPESRFVYAVIIEDECRRFYVTPVTPQQADAAIGRAPREE